MFPITRRTCRPTLSGLNSLLLIIIAEFALINHIASFEKTCGEVNGQTLCYYKASDDGVDWETAWQLCNARNSTLPVIRNRNEQLVFERFLRVQMSGFAVWTSGKAGRDYNSRPSYRYNDLKWLDGRTYTGKDSDSMRHFYSDYRQTPSHYNDYIYICQYRGDTCKYFNDTSNTRNGCVRYSTDRRSWYEARNQCLMSGGDLAVLDDSELDRISHRGKWIGLRRKSWRWIINKTASEEDEIKWTNWSDDWNTLNGECISIDATNGTWKAIRCSEHRRVVCQAGLDLASVTRKSQTVASITRKSQTVASITRKSQADVSYVEQESQSVSYSTFLTVVIIGICVIAILIFVVALIVRKYVYRNLHVASRRETAAEDKSYQDLETTRRQAKPENTYTELALQPVYEEVCERWK